MEQPCCWNRSVFSCQAVLEKRDSRERPPRATQGFAHQLEDALDVMMVVTTLCKAEEDLQIHPPLGLAVSHLSWLTISLLILKSWECRRLKLLFLLHPGTIQVFKYLLCTLPVQIRTWERVLQRVWVGMLCGALCPVSSTGFTPKY